ncbi:MAG: glycosyltransferase family 2 protein [Elusimicrobia bacterium]|nr:glycosyltransferase family 2 protein [Elusimicrobiota bacterium]
MRPSTKPSAAPVVSVVTPAYNEAENLPLLYAELGKALDNEVRWEWIVVDDHSTDATFKVVAQLAAKDPRVRGVRFTRNFGSHRAILCGLERMKGECAVVMAADLQDPPEVVPQLLAKWREGLKVVWAVRAKREGVSPWSLMMSRLYYFMMRRFVGLKDMPAEGADFLLLDRRVAEALREFHENHFSVFAMITWMGFPQAGVVYDKRARLHGTSGWSLEKKLKLALDSIVSFSYQPMRLISGLGFFSVVGGGLWLAAQLSEPAGLGEDWTRFAAVVLLVSGVQWMMLGVLGEYLWRALDEARRRPRFLIEESTE